MSIRQRKIFGNAFAYAKKAARSPLWVVSRLIWSESQILDNHLSVSSNKPLSGLKESFKGKKS